MLYLMDNSNCALIKYILKYENVHHLSHVSFGSLINKLLNPLKLFLPFARRRHTWVH